MTYDKAIVRSIDNGGTQFKKVYPEYAGASEDAITLAQADVRLAQQFPASPGEISTAKSMIATGTPGKRGKLSAICRLTFTTKQEDVRLAWRWVPPSLLATAPFCSGK